MKRFFIDFTLHYILCLCIEVTKHLPRAAKRKFKHLIGINPLSVLDAQTGYAAGVATQFDHLYPK
jgi:hypothetical protein